VRRSIGPWAFAGVAVASFGGPLALAALNAPGLAGPAADSAGLSMLLGAALFALPLLVWLRYSRHVTSSGGLYAFVEAAAGRRAALLQAGVWIVSYLLYLIYTTVQIVYDTLPAAIPGERRFQTPLVLAIPVALAAVMCAGRTVALLVIGALAAGQLGLAGVLDAVTLAHVSTPASSFGAGAPADALARASAQTSLVYVCGSLPLFLGGELARPARTIRTVLPAAALATTVVIVLAVAPLASLPGLTGTDIPGLSVLEQFGGPGIARAVGVGAAASIAGVMLCEYLALSRLAAEVARLPVRRATFWIGAAMVALTPLALIDPEGVYSALAKPSLIALWLSQVIVFAVYPRFARRHGTRRLSAWALAAGATGLSLYGLWNAVVQPVS